MDIRSSLKTIGFAIVLIVAITQIANLVTNVTREINRLTEAHGGGYVWSLSQVEVEYHRLLATMVAPESAEDFREIRNRFDVFYSRASTLKEGRAYGNGRARSDFTNNLDAIFLYLDAATPYIDAEDETLLKELPMLRAETEAVGPVVRALSIAGVKSASAQSQNLRQGANALLNQLVFMALALIIGLAVSFIVMRILYQRSRSDAQEISLSHARIKTMIETSLDAILVTTPGGSVVEANTAALHMFGLNGATLKNIHLAQLIKGGGEINGFVNPGESGLAERGRVQTTGLRKDGSRFAAEVALTQTKTEDLKDVYVAYIRDISNRLRAEEELTSARDKALKGEEAKAKLLAVMNHEIRTPLNGILGSLDLLSQTYLNPNQLKYLRAMETSGEVLMKHVDDVLELSRLDVGFLQPEKRAVNIKQLVKEITDSQVAAAKANGNILKTIVSDDIPVFVLGDKQSLRQALLNLIGNAIKFTENGTITIDVDLFGHSDLIDFRVSDTGPGVPADAEPHVFEDFFTTDASFSRANQGTGLGLGITKRLVKAMGGEIGLESIEGEGAMFWFRVPLPAATPDRLVPKPQAPFAAPSGPSAHVLLVEDNKINQMITNEMLVNAGHRVDLATNGAEALSKAQSTAYDLILMDISMPEMDGFTAAGKIRQSTGASARAPIIALTAQALSLQDPQVTAVGMTDVLAKPMNSEALNQAVLRAIGLNTNRAYQSKALRAKVLDEDVLTDVIDNIGLAKVQDHYHTFSEDMTKFLAKTQKAPAASNDLKSEIHSLAGAAAVLGLCRLHFALCDMEESDAPLTAQPNIAKIWSAAEKRFESGLSIIAKDPS